MDYLIEPGGSLNNEIQVPGDKSISHRAVMLASIANGASEISDILLGEDVRATIAAFGQMGVRIEGPDENNTLVVHGAGKHGLSAPLKPLDMGNSGTGMRLLAGLLCGQGFASTLAGDESLSKRPMLRIVTPLQSMGASITAGEKGTPPLRIEAGELQGIHYELPVASAQVKSAVLLAGLYAEGQTTVTEPEPTRDHTERMLTAFAYPVERAEHAVAVQGGHELQGAKIAVPGDISSAAFFLVGATIAPNSSIILSNVGVNPTRTGIIDILRLMGASIALEHQRFFAGEPIADIVVNTAALHGIEIPPEMVPLAIDEFPTIAIAAACADGMTVLKGAKELRVKESDRISAIVDGLKGLGIDAAEAPDGFTIRGGQITGGSVDSRGDHRIAMAFAMAGLAAKNLVTIKSSDNVATSFPDFHLLAKNAGLRLALAA